MLIIFLRHMRAGASASMANTLRATAMPALMRLAGVAAASPLSFSPIAPRMPTSFAASGISTGATSVEGAGDAAGGEVSSDASEGGAAVSGSTSEANATPLKPRRKRKL